MARCLRSHHEETGLIDVRVIFGTYYQFFDIAGMGYVSLRLLAIARPALIKQLPRKFYSWRCIDAHGKFPAMRRQPTTDRAKAPNTPRLPKPAKVRPHRNALSLIWPSA
ncbi:MAG: hypothetical protein CMJ81_17370 [Planctomycetaceae bacterium]|nr:hypothetical protein [Planctomycetaceae bacterium]MBP62145.1 hypothetical protein [Planctomycetaceae bacterium]